MFKRPWERLPRQVKRALAADGREARRKARLVCGVGLVDMDYWEVIYAG